VQQFRALPYHRMKRRFRIATFALCVAAGNACHDVTFGSGVDAACAFADCGAAGRCDNGECAGETGDGEAGGGKAGHDDDSPGAGSTSGGAASGTGGAATGGKVMAVGGSGVATAPVAEPCDDGAFTLVEQGPFTVTEDPRSITSGDLDRDGFPDLVIAGGISGYIRVLMNLRGTGFAATQSYRAGDFASHVTLGDFDEDGFPDVAVTVATGVSVLLNQGDGTYGPRVTYEAGSAPTAVVAADFDDDGHLDLAATNMDSEDVTVSLGRGDGTFEFLVSYPLGDGGSAIAAADFDQDEAIDIVAAKIDDPGSGVCLLRNPGDGTFRDVQHIEGAVGASAVAALDVDGNGHAEVIAADLTQISVFQTSAAREVWKWVYPAGSAMGAIAIADFDLDGRVDLAVSNLAVASSYVTILLNRLSGFTLSDHQSGDGSTYGVTAADFNLDGRPDLAFPRNGGYVGVLFNTCKE
jgi:hypothetical protein